MTGRLENLIGVRRLAEYCPLRLDGPYLLGYEVDEDWPWHATSRHPRPLYPAAGFEPPFAYVFAQGVSAGLAAGTCAKNSRCASR